MNQAASDSITNTGNALTGLACNVGQNVSELGKAARGALIQASQNGNSFFQELVSTGQSVRARTSKTARSSAAVTFDWQAWLASSLGLPTRKDIDSLNKKLDRINRKVNKLAREQQA